jgi:penicillin-binding protein 1C
MPMEEDNRPDDPQDARPEGEDASPDEERTPRPPSRLDRLLRAKEAADRAAEEWSEPRREPEHPIEEPPRRPDDTPLGQDTPPEGMRPVQPPGSEPEAGPGPEEAAEPEPGPETDEARQYRSYRDWRDMPPPPFPHPTDRPGQARPVDLSYEPPPPDELDRPTPSQGVRPVEEETPPEEPEATPRHLREVRLDDEGMPLPRRATQEQQRDEAPLPRQVTQEDFDATQVGPSAYQDNLDEGQPTVPHEAARPYDESEQQTVPSRPVRGRYDDQNQSNLPSRAVIRPAPPPRRTAPPPPEPPRQPPPARREPKRRRPRRRKQRTRRPLRLSWGCFTRTFSLILVGMIVAIMLGGGGTAIYYSQVTAPSFRGIREVADLQARALQFQTTRIRDREGNVLYELNDPEGGFRDYVSISDVSPWVIVATVATEERGYFINPGFSIPGIARALVQNYQEGQVVSGASTITQQLTRALLLPEEERTQRTYERKVKEIFLAAELGRRFDKMEILELYLNQIYYGNLAYGIEAAAQTYFGKSARDLNLAEAAFLAGLPQAPAIYDPVTNKEDALARQQQVLGLMLEAGCIDTGGTGLSLPCTTQEVINQSEQELIAVATREYQAPNIQTKYPHWVVYIQQLLEADPTIGPAIYTSGFDVYTTLDPRVQELAQTQVTQALAALEGRNVNNASVIVVDVHTGAILAMVGSRDFNDASIDGQVNIALTPQQPGSSIKPFTYLAAFRQGWTPATVIWDVPIEYQIPGFGTYAPVNYSGQNNGPVTVRYAIANSLNIPAVITLDHVGVPALLQVLNDVGISSLGSPANENNFGLSLTLGAGEVYLLEWTDAFATIANGGVYRPTYAIERIERDGQVIEGYPYQVPPGEQVLDPGHAYLMQSILSDTEARIPSFGQNTPLSPPYPAGAKTGTTNDFRDNWTMGFTTEIAVGVWVGNTDNSPMVNVTGVTGAGPIWRGIMDGATEWYPPQSFSRPPSVFPQTVCADDGTLAEDYTFCLEHSQTNTELFVEDPPGVAERLYRSVTVDTFSGLLASENCQAYTEERFYLYLENPSQLIDMRPFIRSWLVNTNKGLNWLAARGIDPAIAAQPPPTERCPADTPQPQIAITHPTEGSVQGNVVTVTGTVDAPNFSRYRVEFGVSNDPIGWGVVQGDTSVRVTDGPLGQVDLSSYEDGPITIRVIVFDTEGHSAEERVHFTLEKAEPTPTPEPDDGG